MGKGIEKNKFIIGFFMLCWLFCIPLSAQEIPSGQLASDESRPVAQLEKEQPELKVNGISTEYQFVDCIYGAIPKGAKKGTAYRKRTLVQDNSSYLDTDPDGWLISGQTWTERSGKKYFRTYFNTTGISLTLPDGDYDVKATYYNAGEKNAKISIWDERGRQTADKRAEPEKEEQKNFTVSVINNNLKLFFAADRGAAVATAGDYKIYVKEIAITSLPKRKAKEKPTIYIMGDSTAHSKREWSFPREGWGQEFYRCFRSEKLVRERVKKDEEALTPYTEYKMKSFVIENRAFSGESTGSFWRDGKFDNLLNVVSPGDCVLIQYGHNDANKEKLGYYTPVNDYKNNLITLALACKRRGAVCLFLSPTPRCRFQHGRIKTTLPEYKAAMKEAAVRTGTPFVDTGKAVENYMNTVGEKQAKSYYMLLKPGEYPNYPDGYHDFSHYNEKGAKKAAHIIGVTLKESGRLPAVFANKITVSPDYYYGVAADIQHVRTKKYKKQYKITWPVHKFTKYYAVYQYDGYQKKYKKVAVTKNNYCILKAKNIKDKTNKIRVQAYLTRK